MSEAEVLREDLEEKAMEINVLKEYEELPNDYGEVNLQKNKDNVIILEDFIFQKDSTIHSRIDAQSEDYKKYYDWSNEREIGMIAKVKNDTIISKNLNTYEQRNRVINELYNQSVIKLYKGVCIDFEEIDDVNSFYRFLIELTPKFKESGLKVIVKLNHQIEQEKIKNIVDFAI